MRHADQDGWLIRVTGDIKAGHNGLILSTEDAVTSDNYQVQRRRRRRHTHRGFGFDHNAEPPSLKGTVRSKLYSATVRSGIVTYATWLMIQGMPPALRCDCENLAAESIVLYPRKLVARDGIEYDELVARCAGAELPWQASIDLERMRLVCTDVIDDSYVALKYPIGQYAGKIGEFRRQAQQTEGKGSGADAAWKVHANSMYGVLACPHLDTNNFVAANQITGQARAEAFALLQPLNGFQVITDGCTYRLDQIPACTFAECLEIFPDYPIRRAEADSGIPFIDPATIPTDDAGFTEWYRTHVRSFFGISGRDYDELFATHELEHKQTGVTKATVFDALATDGGANYAKLTRDTDGGWRVEDLAARAYGRESKTALQPWIVATYSRDLLTDLPPITEDRTLLKYKPAGQKARRALAAGLPEVYYPLGLEFRQVKSYRAIKPSGFVFQTPEQRRTIEKQIAKFNKRTGCGLELLALRKSYGARQHGSLVAIARQIESLIRSGKTDLTKCLNLNRLSRGLIAVGRHRLRQQHRMKARAEADLHRQIDCRTFDAPALLTGYMVTNADQVRIDPVE
jgi:hypothetical protein